MLILKEKDKRKNMQEAKFYLIKNSNTITCQLCHHNCQILKNKTGICRVRTNQNNKLYSLVYGFPVALNVDPVEKKPLYHFMPGTFSYSLGTYGCNFSCANCQNWQISQAQKLDNLTKNLIYIPPEKIIDEALGNDCKSISYTYNEPTIFAEYALDIMKLAQKNKLKNIWVSNGYMSETCLDAIFPYLDAINVDLKSMEEKFYLTNCGAKLAPVLRNLIRLKQEQIHLEITTLIIPTLSDDLEMLNQIADFIVADLGDDTPWHISKFSPEISWKQRNLSPTDDDIIYEAFEIGKKAGLKYIYVGNMPGDENENTYCPKCKELVVRRFGYNIERFDSNGRCPNCDKDLDIVD